MASFSGFSSSPWTRRLCLLAVMLAALASVVGRAPGEDAALPGLPELVRTKHRVFSIPFRIPKTEDPDADAAPQKVVLNVSTDLGVSWRAAGEAAASATTFTFRADTDGEYWFRLRAIDRKGRSRGGEGPDIRVLVDAAGPRLTGRVWKGADGEIVCRYAAADDSLNLQSLKVEYRGPGDNGWKAIAPQAVLARENPAHLVGEEIWWAGEKVQALTVRISIADSSGNPAVKQLTLEPTDPGVDQAALAKEIGVPPLPEQAAGVTANDTLLAPPVADADATRTNTGQSWAAEQSGTWSDGQPASTAAPVTTGPNADRSVLVRPTATSRGTLPTAADRPAPPQQPIGDAPFAAAANGGLEYRGRPLQITKSRRFAWDYEIPDVRSSSGRLQAELWTTQDGGVTWQRAAVDGDGRSPIDVTLPAAGLYGVRLELVADTTAAATGPRSGSGPDAWLGIDEEPPQAELVAISRDESTPDGALVIRYAVRDPLISPRATRLLYSPSGDGPWATIADGLENQGEHRWAPDRSVPAKVFVRVEAADLAGNVGVASSPDEVSIAAPRFGGKLGGLRPLPTAP